MIEHDLILAFMSRKSME